MIQYNIEALNRLKVGGSEITYDGTSEVHSKEILTPTGSSLNWTIGYNKSIESVTFDEGTGVLHFSFKDGSSTQINLAISDSTTEDITVLGVGSVGGYDEGNIIPTGSTLQSFIKGLVQKRVPATYTAPVLVVSGGSSATHESGSTVVLDYTSTFNQNDAGSLILNDVTYLGNTLSGSENPKNFNFALTATSTTTIEFTSSYNAGPVKNDNFGDPSPTGKIEAGSLSVSRQVKFGLYNFYGPGNATTNTTVRALPNTPNTNFILNTGTTESTMTIAIPATRNLSSVIDLDALNLNITANYTLVNSNLQVTLPNGDNVSYEVYQLQLASSYSSNHRHSITLN